MCLTSVSYLNSEVGMAWTRLIISFSSGMVASCTPEITSITGYGQSDLEMVNFISLIHPEDQFLYAQVVDDFWSSGVLGEISIRLLDASSEYREMVLRVAGRSQTDEELQIMIDIALLQDQDDLLGPRDAQPMVSFEIQSVTGLYGLDYLFYEYERIQSVVGVEVGGLALLVIDIDRFAIIQSALGVSGSNSVLGVVAHRFEDALGGVFPLVHIEKDRFGLLCIGITEVAQVEMVTRTLRSILDTPVVAPDGEEVVVTACVGVTIVTNSDFSGQDLLSQAMAARDRAKARGASKVEYYSDLRSSSATDRRSFENIVRRAIDSSELVVLFQPIISLAHRRICGVEALVRMHHPERGLISPIEFIPVAKEIGRLPRLGTQVGAAALSALTSWSQLYPDQLLTMGINLSGDELDEPDVVEALISQLDNVTIAKDRIFIELGALDLDPKSRSHASIERLSEYGVSLSVDEFGAGISALGIFSRYPVSQVKIDRSLVLSLGENERSYRVMGGLVKLAHSLDAEVVGIGVERAEQIRIMRALEIDKVQGYHIGQPVEKEQIDTQLELLSASHEGL